MDLYTILQLMLSGVKRVFQRNYIKHGSSNYFGDSEYPLELWLLVPFPDHVQYSLELRFNITLSGVRVISEHINGLLKGRFKSVHGHRTLHYNTARCAKIIYSCAVLHNMCRQFNVPLPPDGILPAPPRPVVQVVAGNDHDWFNEGGRHREQLVRRHYTNM
ncbi:hypothetical protein NQ314_011198 [Rhamnusium bicolor]|uniref:DDE Tnp4 domain-containing protein n=1 Tax=Rhamnusium bicolor TaxID=1586634 RepID=A0AAV8XJN7_9CUCU|nr:hypothetical protein NQ314_011198 [Rhamnusium bicolor]